MLADHFSKFLSREHRVENHQLDTLFADLSRAVDAGSSCLNLAEYFAHQELDEQHTREALACDKDGSAVSSGAGFSPLVLAEDRLYLRRYYHFESQLAAKLRSFSQQDSTSALDVETALLDKLFPPLDGEVDYQRKAAELAMKSRLTIISGGPGTGKTTTVVKILTLLKSAAAFTSPEQVMILAPTGKAADRLRQSILSGINYIQATGEISSTLLDQLPSETATIHRALGYRPGKLEFRHGANHPLQTQLVIIDEASMVDLPLMKRLLDAIPDNARIIMLGDQHQLSSIQVGTVLADLMAAAEDGSSCVSANCVTLQKSYRTSGPVKACCEAIRDGEANEAWDTVLAGNTNDAGSISHEKVPHQLISKLTPWVKKFWLPVIQDTSLLPAEKLDLIDQFRILTPIHRGPYGVAAVNAAVDRALYQAGINTEREWYAGRSIIIGQNDHQLGLYNGDTGLCLPDPTKPGKFMIVLRSADGVRTIDPARLPKHQTAWALTIHRTQGSEYNNILMIVPPVDDFPMLSRELMYTGLSRAKNHAHLWTSERHFKFAIEQKVNRASGLAPMLQID